MDHALVLHYFGGSPQSVLFEAPVVATQMVDGGIHVIVKDEAGAVAGHAKFCASSNPIVLVGAAIAQYTPMSQPGVRDAQT